MRLSPLPKLLPFVLLFLLYSIPSLSLSNDDNIIGFKINSLPWPPEIGEFSSFTFFNFGEVQFEIWNPYSQSIEIHTPNQNLVNVSATFHPSNASLAFFIPWGVYPAPNTFLLEPGLTVASTSFCIEVNSTSLNSFPLGYYIFWIDLDFRYDSYYSVISFSTYVNITTEETIISHEPIPSTWGETIYTVDSSDIPISSTSFTLFVVLLSFISLANLSKHRNYS